MSSNPIYEGADLEALATLHRYQSWIVETFQPYISGRVVEFGAGIGNISQRIRPLVSSLDLVEPSANLVAPLRKRFEGDTGVVIFGEVLESRLPAIDDETYDCVVLVNVLEHIEDDSTALEGFFKILKPGGHLLLFVPALKFLYSDLDALVGHFRRYQRDELNGRVVDAGFEIIRSRYFDTLGVAPWWLLNTMMGATGFNPLLVSIYDAVFAPLSRGLESLAPPPFGKNILLIAKRPET
ncbi:MAG: class I SAM-dependent methyltransferase [Rhodospirillales bacterium]|nr:class I SAM-dependent methyltransferase [Rhodospirillales bacterium]